MADMKKYLGMDGVVGGLVGAGAGLILVQQMGPFDQYVELGIMGAGAYGAMSYIGKRDDWDTTGFVELGAATAAVAMFGAQFI